MHFHLNCKQYSASVFDDVQPLKSDFCFFCLHFPPDFLILRAINFWDLSFSFADADAVQVPIQEAYSPHQCRQSAIP